MIMMLRSLWSALLAFSAPETCVNKEFDQCGGKEFKGDTCCPTYDNCSYVNDFYFQCQPKDLCLNPEFGQCGGKEKNPPFAPWDKAHHHQTCCPDSFYCSKQDDYYSQCLYNSSLSKCAEQYQQCGGIDSDGKPWGSQNDPNTGYKKPELTCCQPGYNCTPDASAPTHFSSCKPVPVCSNARFGQCGGIDSEGHPWTSQYDHSDCCPTPQTCVKKTEYFSQCLGNFTA